MSVQTLASCQREVSGSVMPMVGGWLGKKGWRLVGEEGLEVEGFLH